eukprot:2929585-Pyramimonas_sp.AAC.1
MPQGATGGHWRPQGATGGATGGRWRLAGDNWRPLGATGGVIAPTRMNTRGWPGPSGLDACFLCRGPSFHASRVPVRLAGSGKLRPGQAGSH